MSWDLVRLRRAYAAVALDLKLWGEAYEQGVQAQKKIREIRAQEAA